MMKKLAAACILLAALCAAAHAQVDTGDLLYAAHCEEFIALRTGSGEGSPECARVPLYAELVYLDAAENGSCRVSWNGFAGYVPSAMLETLYCYEGAPLEAGAEQRYNINLFLSNFTEQDFMSRSGVYNAYDYEDWQLNEFAIRHIWLNRPDYIERGEYANGCNLRLSADLIPAVAQKYFGREAYDPAWTHFSYRDGYYYWQDAESCLPGGFACLESVEDLGGGRIGVHFKSCGIGFAWNNDVCYYSVEQAQSVFPSERTPKGYAVINLGGGTLEDRSTWSLEYWAYAG